ncbi:hypothetical protein SLNSH_22745 [Alsobacter soli]|uniref:Uncharacterized protein n=1 Tax=Alsobacter soli TaxID=2109933 RepID=A0A2T1HM01_9HYPH|nr:hypothetical protein [Alsobacter soli]PSC02684.1 hypothetical protein SLNSH_22745 [Alsobacter soli]
MANKVVRYEEPVPAPSSVPAVRVRGDAPQEPFHWLGLQWVVTDEGVEARDGTYFIAKDRLREDEPHWSWEQQMAEKDWVDVHDFAAAMAFARHKWPA